MSQIQPLILPQEWGENVGVGVWSENGYEPKRTVPRSPIQSYPNFIVDPVLHTACANIDDESTGSFERSLNLYDPAVARLKSLRVEPYIQTASLQQVSNTRRRPSILSS